MTTQTLSRPALLRLVYSRLLMGFPCLALVLFLPAGTLAYWQAWVYLGVLLIPMLAVLSYLLKHDPALLERRLRMREKRNEQKAIIALAFVWFVLAFGVPGLDRRWGWSDVPVWVVLLADVLVLLGYSLFFLVLRENSYAARTVQVEQGQKVIDTGPYAVVRHPMYAGSILMYMASPLALGSYWAMLLVVLIIPLLVARIVSEEKMLRRELVGYEEYTRAVRYRLLPGIW